MRCLLQDLRRSNFTSADVRKASFANANLQGAYFMKSVAFQTNFEVRWRTRGAVHLHGQRACADQAKELRSCMPSLHQLDKGQLPAHAGRQASAARCASRGRAWERSGRMLQCSSGQPPAVLHCSAPLLPLLRRVPTSATF